MTKVRLLSHHELVEEVYALDIDNVFVGKPTDEDLITVILKDGQRVFCDELEFIEVWTAKELKPYDRRNETMKEEILGILNSLVIEIQKEEDECFSQMAYMSEHKFELEREAIHYRQQAYNRCWLKVASKRDKIEKMLKQ